MDREREDAEARRVAAVDRLGLISAGDDERLDRIARLATRSLGCPIALISLLDAEHQWVQSCVGLQVDVAPRTDAFCDLTIRAPEPMLVIEDATTDPRVATNPHVTGAPFIGFYAGRVVRDPSGEAVGTICVLDHVARTFTDEDRAVLDDLAALVEQEFVRHVHLATLLDVDASERSKALVLANLTEGLVLQDAGGRIVEWNPATEQLLGLSGEELAGRTSTDPSWQVVHTDGSPWAGDDHPATVALRTGVGTEDETMGVHRSDGTLVWLRVNAQPIIDEDGNVAGVVVAFADVTVQHDLQLSLERSEEAARASLDALEQGVILTSGDGSIRRVNPSAERVLGYSAAELDEMLRRGTFVTYDTHGRPLAVADRPLVRARVSGTPVYGETIGWRRPDGELVLLRASCIPDADGADGMVVAFTDVTAEHRMLADLTRFRYLFQNANDIITVVDETGMAQYSSPSTERVLGYPEGWHHAGGILAMVHPDDLGIAARELERLVENRQGGEPFLVRVQAFDGGWRHIECIGVNLLHEPAVEGIVITARDATERVRLTEELAHRASHDALTDLPNRRMLEHRLEDALARSDDDDTLLGLCFVDLDGFKHVNDTLGHAAGDELLRRVAANIRGAIRGGDMAARVGGDEFVVVLEPVSSHRDALGVAQRIRDAVLDARTADALGFGASVGLAVSEHGDTPSSILRRADDALYRAKSTHDSSITLAEGPSGLRAGQM